MNTIIYYKEDEMNMRGDGIESVECDGQEMDFWEFIEYIQDEFPILYDFAIYITSISNAGGVTLALDYDCDTPDAKIDEAYECLEECNIEWRAV